MWTSVWWSPPPHSEMVTAPIWIYTRLCKYVCAYMCR